MFVYNTVNRSKRQPTKCEEVLANHVAFWQGKYPKYVKNQSAPPHSQKNPMILQN